MSATKTRRGKLPVPDRLQIRSFDSTKSGMLRLIEEYEAELRQINEDWRDSEGRNFADYRAQLLQEAQERARARFEELKADAAETLKAGGERAQRMRVDTPVDPTARDRVRRLLDSGTGPVEVLRRARELREPETIAALRQELLWQGLEADRTRPGPHRIERFFAIQDGADPAQANTEEVLYECDRSIAELGGPGADQARELVHMREEAVAWPQLLQLGAAVVLGIGNAATARMAYAMAEADAGEQRVNPNLSLSGEAVPAGAAS